MNAAVVIPDWVIQYGLWGYLIGAALAFVVFGLECIADFQIAEGPIELLVNIGSFVALVALWPITLPCYGILNA